MTRARTQRGMEVRVESWKALACACEPWECQTIEGLEQRRSDGPAECFLAGLEQ